MSSQITHQACEEGWSFIAEWHGVRLSHVLNLVGVSAKARYVVVNAYDDNWDSLDMADAYPSANVSYLRIERRTNCPRGMVHRCV